MPQRHDQGVKKRMARSGANVKNRAEKKQERRARQTRKASRWWAAYVQAESQRRAWPEGKER